MNKPTVIHLATVREDRQQINEQCKKMLHQALVYIIKLQIISEDFLSEDLPIEQLRQMEENVSRILEQAEAY